MNTQKTVPDSPRRFKQCSNVCDKLKGFALSIAEKITTSRFQNHMQEGSSDGSRSDLLKFELDHIYEDWTSTHWQRVWKLRMFKSVSKVLGKKEHLSLEGNGFE